MLHHFDVETALRRFRAAIERDQFRVDSLPREKFHPSYDDVMWRDWRKGHIIVLNRLISTVADMRPSLLERLSAIAKSWEPELVRAVILENFSDVVSGSIDQDEYATVSQFFEDLIRPARKRTSAIARGHSPKVSLARWFPFSDPLRIAADSECGYCYPVSLALLIA